MTDPYQQYPQHTAGYDPQPGFGTNYGVSYGTGPQQPYPVPQGGQPWSGQPWSDAMAPYGRDPRTGEPYSDKSKIAGGLLQIFLGQFGIGRFYIGDAKTGAIQLSLTILGFLLAIVLVGFVLIFAVGIWALIDGILMLAGSVRDPQGRPLRP